MLGGCGGSPTCQSLVPAESTSMSPARPAASTRARNTASAVGERQMLPRHTISTRIRSLMSLLHNTPHGLEIGGRVDTGGYRRAGQRGMDGHALLHRTQLLQLLDGFQPARG